MIEGVARKKQKNYSNSVGNGYVIIPTKIDRDDYVTTCFRRERVTIIGDNGQGVFKDCYISREAIRDIVFPIDNEFLGSCVSFIVDGFNNNPIIIGILSKESESQLLEEGEFKIEKIFGNSKISINGKAKTGDLIIDVSNEDGKGTLILNVMGKSGSKFKIFCGGEAVIYSENKLSLETTNEINIKSFNSDNVDDFSEINVTKDLINVILSEEGLFKVNGGGKPLVLGTNNSEILSDIKSLLTDFNTYLTIFSATQVTASVGVLVPLVAGFTKLGIDLTIMIDTIIGLVIKIEQNNSKKSFTD